MSSYLILAIISSLSPSVLSAEWLDCGPPKSFQVELENDDKVFVYDAEFKIRFERDNLAVYDHPGLNAVNFLINDTLIMFAGHIVPENEEFDPDALKTSRVFDSKIAGSARLKKTLSGEMVLTDYKLYLSRKRKEEEKHIPKRVQKEIIHEAVACVKAKMDEKVNAVTSEDLERGKNHPFEFGLLSVLSSQGNESRLNAEDIKTLVAAYNSADLNSGSRSGLQSTINKIVDMAVSQLVQKIEEENHGKVQIPELHQNFTTGSSFWKITGDFDAFDGTFVDLTSLKRTDNATVSHIGSKFTATCGFGLSKAFMQYDAYKLRYGVAKVSGKLSGSVDGVAMSAMVGLDYNRKPCQAVLQDLGFSELGKIKIKITGLGPLNKLLSKLVTWITKKWQEEIVTKIELKLRDIIVKNLNKLDCEKYRP